MPHAFLPPKSVACPVFTSSTPNIAAPLPFPLPPQRCLLFRRGGGGRTHGLVSRSAGGWIDPSGRGKEDQGHIGGDGIPRSRTRQQLQGGRHPPLRSRQRQHPSNSRRGLLPPWLHVDRATLLVIYGVSVRFLEKLMLMMTYEVVTTNPSDSEGKADKERKGKDQIIGISQEED
ncbi:unnamed protein product [Miscanthus lutarioriparius]|uniref:Uncharacterized protein n=1 Tax=Miscanthus lutarioriparius TaxID=422564 RepID=A0A811R6J4_9POAL|nr:unnamed protein product [Miscanthus lutarioriparius]CAD6340713.1 unnamed protein product [Miscanthus lutarioriparius]